MRCCCSIHNSGRRVPTPIAPPSSLFFGLIFRLAAAAAPPPPPFVPALQFGHAHSLAFRSFLAFQRPDHAPLPAQFHVWQWPRPPRPTTLAPASSCRRRGSASERDGGPGGVQGRVPAAVPERPRRARPAPPPAQEEAAGRHRQSRVSPRGRGQQALPCAVPGLGTPPSPLPRNPLSRPSLRAPAGPGRSPGLPRRTSGPDGSASPRSQDADRG